RSFLLLFTAGVFAVIGILSKHNGGLPALGVYGLLIVTMLLPDWKATLKYSSFFALGVVVAAGAFTGWLVLYSDLSNFIYHVITIPKEVGAERLAAGGKRKFIRGLLVSLKCNYLIRSMLFTWAVLFVVHAGIRLSRWKQMDVDKRLSLVGA